MTMDRTQWPNIGIAVFIFALIAAGIGYGCKEWNHWTTGHVSGWHWQSFYLLEEAYECGYYSPGSEGRPGHYVSQTCWREVTRTTCQGIDASVEDPMPPTAVPYSFFGPHQRVTGPHHVYTVTIASDEGQKQLKCNKGEFWCVPTESLVSYNGWGKIIWEAEDK